MISTASPPPLRIPPNRQDTPPAEPAKKFKSLRLALYGSNPGYPTGTGSSVNLRVGLAGTKDKRRQRTAQQVSSTRGRSARPMKISGVDRTARALVEAQRLHDEERGRYRELLDIRGGQHPGVLGDHGRGGALGDGIEVALYTSPDVLPVPHVIRHRVDARQCLPGAGFDVGDVLLVQGDVFGGASLP